MSKFDTLPTLGAGLGFRAEMKSDVFRFPEEIDWLEVIADHYIDAPRGKMEELDLLLQHFTVIPHGIHLSIGSAEGLDPVYLEKLAGLIERIDPPWWSEHLAFTQAAGRPIGHLSPLPFSQEAIEVVARNAETVRSVIGTPLILENITYTHRVPGDQMSEPEFLHQALDAAQCGLLLDLTNVHTNAFNHHFDPVEFLAALPLERVVQCHVVGGHEENGFLIDSHSAPVPEAVWDLLRGLVINARVRGVLLERDEHIPPLKELLPDLRTARDIMEKVSA
jgi:uncharacterized protein (UPF0276 family)